MDTAVGLVQAYLRLNGYFTVTEYPVITKARSGDFRTATDLDVLAFRFPGAGRLVPGKRPGSDEYLTHVDEALGVASKHADMLIGEVKEGRAVVNEAASDPSVLRVVLTSFGCCPPADAPAAVESLLRRGSAPLPNGHRIRMAVFASLTKDADPRYLTISLGHILGYMRGYIDEHWEVLRHSDTRDPALGFLMTIAKAERGQK